MEWTSFKNELRMKPNSSGRKTKRKLPKRNAKLQWKQQVRVMSHRREEGRVGGRNGRKRRGRSTEGRKEDDAKKYEYV